MDHFWIILGPFSTILLTVLSTLCQWSCGLVHHFLEAKLLEQVNLHFWFNYNTHCWFNMLLCTCTMSHLCLEVRFLDHFCEHESVDHFFFSTYIFGSFFYTNWWINMVLCTCTMCYHYYPLDHHVSAWMVLEIVDHFAGQWGGGRFMG